MLRTGNAGVRPREMALPEKRRGGVPAGRFEIWGFCRFPLPCFGSECHTFGLKIATAALRPRNDTNLKCFCFGNGRFCFMRPFRAETLRTLLCSHFCAVLPRTVFKRFVLKTVSLGKPPGGCSCPESAAGRNKSAVRRKNTQPGKRKNPADILDFLNSFSILYALFFSKYHRQIRQENRNLFVYFAD